MQQVYFGDVFKIKKHFSYGKIDYGVGEKFKVARIARPNQDSVFSITVVDMFGNRQMIFDADRFLEYIYTGYFEKANKKKGTNMNEQFELQVGDIIETKEDTFTIVKDCRGCFYAVSHDDYNMLEVEGMFVKYEPEDGEIRKVHRHSVYGGDNFDYDDYTLTIKTQVYPKPKVKLTLSEIKSKFQIENEEVEIDFEN